MVDHVIWLVRCINGSKEFPIEWDKSILDYPVSQIGYIGLVSFNEEGEPDIGWKKLVPKKYQEFSKVFSPEAVAELPPHREFDHAIDIKEGEQPPWGPIYPMSEKELRVLYDHINTELKNGKIRYSKSPAGAPILFVPKAHGRGL